MSTIIPALPAPTVHVTLFTQGARKARRKWAGGRDPDGTLSYCPPCQGAEIFCTPDEAEEFERYTGVALDSADVLPAKKFEWLAGWLQENAGLKLDLVLGYPARP